MNWQVTSSIYGGQSYSTAQREAYETVANALLDQAQAFSALSASWQTTALQLNRHRVSATMCSASYGSGLSSGIAGANNASTVQHASLPYSQLIEQCNEHAQQCTRISEEFTTMAHSIIRAHSLYAEAELAALRNVNAITSRAATIAPSHLAVLGGYMAVDGYITKSKQEGASNPIHASDTVSWAYEGFLSGLASHLLLLMRIPHYGAAPVNAAASVTAMLSAPFKNLAQGNTLCIREVQAQTDVVRSSHSVASGMENLRRLAEERLGTIELHSGLSYATIAVQRYRRADGTDGWLVLVPGTDGQEDSPFGWEQNVELMSDKSWQRKRADSLRLVNMAMSKAGIGKDDEVAIIGHSQGGIVAAAAAADLQDRYNITHVVTAGSPIANHPIPEQTWVTSIEIEDEVVASLDGKTNPVTPQWLTIRGQVSAVPGTTAMSTEDDGSYIPEAGMPQSELTGALVANAPKQKEITHWLKYHQAAYAHASDQGSYAVTQHEQHFQEIIDGELLETHYYEGRMLQSTPPEALQWLAKPKVGIL